MTVIEHGGEGCVAVGFDRFGKVTGARDLPAGEPRLSHEGVYVPAEQLRGAVEDIGTAVDLLNHARCTDLGTDDKSWWRVQRDRLIEKWGR